MSDDDRREEATMADDVPQLTLEDYQWAAALARARLFGDRNTAEVAAANMHPARAMVALVNMLVSHLRATAHMLGTQPEMLLQSLMDSLRIPPQDDDEEE